MMVSCSTAAALDLLVFVVVSLATVTITTTAPGRHVASALVNNVAAPSPRRSRSTGGTGRTPNTQDRANPLIQDFFATLEKEEEVDSEEENGNAKGGKSIQLNIGIDVQGRSDAAAPASRLAINGLAIELLNEDADSKRPLMPGSNGPTPQLSGGNGPRALKVLSEGFFVNMKGMQTIPLRNGCWEMNWRDGAPAGTLILGFDLEKEVQRNEAKLPMGSIYLSFPVFDKFALAELQLRMKQQEAEVRECKDKANGILSKFNEETNLLMKALHYRNYFRAMEKTHATKQGYSNNIPSPGADDALEIHSQIVLMTKGTVWNKGKGDGQYVFGSFGGGDPRSRRHEHVLLGSATTRRLSQTMNK